MFVRSRQSLWSATPTRVRPTSSFTATRDGAGARVHPLTSLTLSSSSSSSSLSQLLPHISVRNMSARARQPSYREFPTGQWPPKEVRVRVDPWLDEARVKLGADGVPDSPEVTLSSHVFGSPLRPDLLQRAVVWYLANKRGVRPAAGKGRRQVRGTTRKPFAQKGGGRARQGSLRGPHQKGGAVAHPAVRRDFSQDMPKKVRSLAMRTALSTKVAQGRLRLVPDTVVTTHRTKPVAVGLNRLMNQWGDANDQTPSMLIVDHRETDTTNLQLATRTIPRVKVIPVTALNVYDILKYNHLVLSLRAARYLEERHLRFDRSSLKSHPVFQSALGAEDASNWALAEKVEEIQESESDEFAL